jgi:hypothetical protein
MFRCNESLDRLSPCTESGVRTSDVDQVTSTSLFETLLSVQPEASRNSKGLTHIAQLNRRRHLVNDDIGGTKHRLRSHISTENTTDAPGDGKQLARALRVTGARRGHRR